jgi:hypothetical protein
MREIDDLTRAEILADYRRDMPLHLLCRKFRLPEKELLHQLELANEEVFRISTDDLPEDPQLIAKEKALQRSREYYYAHKDECKKKVKEWISRNKKRYRESQKSYREKVRLWKTGKVGTPHLSEDEILKIYELRDKGLSYTQISRELGRSRNGVVVVLRKRGVKI